MIGEVVMKRDIQGKILELTVGDITQQQVDAIVNAANSSLAGGGGVDGAIHRRGGPKIMFDTQLRYPAGCPTGSAVISVAGNLPAKHVIHAVGPRWNGGRSGEADLLASAYRTAFDLASQHDCQSVALPAVSCGVYGYPVDLASRIALTTAKSFLEKDSTIELARFVLFSDGIFGAFGAALEELVG
jgi:O-acetyl-ADP-ribose deacetylase (regulator of RNase III)